MSRYTLYPCLNSLLREILGSTLDPSLLCLLSSPRCPVFSRFTLHFGPAWLNQLICFQSWRYRGHGLEQRIGIQEKYGASGAWNDRLHFTILWAPHPHRSHFVQKTARTNQNHSLHIREWSVDLTPSNSTFRILSHALLHALLHAHGNFPTPFCRIFFPNCHDKKFCTKELELPSAE